MSIEVTDRGSEFLTVGECAAELRVNRRTVRRWINDGRLPATQVGGRYTAIRIPRRGLDALLWGVPERMET
jgi:excisionase family DNA binding protein